MAGTLDVLGQTPFATEIRTQFLARLERNFQVPTFVRCDRVMVATEGEAMYVASMHHWMTTRRVGVMANALPPINAPATWHVLDVRALTVRQGETENDLYRARRLEYLLTRVAGLHVAFDELDIFRREREATRRYILENLHGPNDVEALFHYYLRGFPSLPGVVQQNLIAVGITVPRLRAWHYFGYVLEVAEAYELESPA